MASVVILDMLFSSYKAYPATSSSDFKLSYPFDIWSVIEKQPEEKPIDGQKHERITIVEPQIEIKIEKLRPEIVSTPIKAKRKRTGPANKGFQVVFIKRYFARKNPEIDPALFDWEMLIDGTLHIGENIANLSEDEQLRAFNW